MNGDDQSVIVDLPGSLHNGSSVTTDEHPNLKIDIPSPMPDQQDCAHPPLGRVHATLAATTPKISWKPRITLTAEVGNLLDWGMTEDYNHELEHSAMAKEFTTEVGTSPTTEDGGAGPAIGHFLSSKCCGHRGLHGK